MEGLVQHKNQQSGLYLFSSREYPGFPKCGNYRSPLIEAKAVIHNLKGVKLSWKKYQRQKLVRF